MRNKILLLIFGTLLLVFILSKLFSNQQERTFDPEFIKVDTLKITSIKLKTKADSLKEVVMTKENEDWFVSKSNLKVPASPTAVESLFSNVAALRASYIAAKSKDKWAEFELEDDQASRLTFLNGSKILAEVFIGRYSVNQVQQQITSFFRVQDGHEVYAVEGMAGMLLGQGFDSYRSKAALLLDIAKIESLEYTGDHPFSVKKVAQEWVLNGNEKLDTAKVRDFLFNLRQMSGDDFVPSFDPNMHQEKLLKTLKIGGSNMQEPVVVRCWRDTARTKPFIIQSSQYPYSFFASDSARLFTRIFKPVEDW